MKSVEVRKNNRSANLPPNQITEQTTPDVVMNEMVEGLIRERAYQLYLERGQQDGHAQADWYAAEQQILQQLAKEAA
jgi:hypothetical protein